MRRIEGRWKVRTQGLNSENRMEFIAYTSCGDIDDGVGFNIGDGVWVISLADLKEMVSIAETARQE